MNKDALSLERVAALCGDIAECAYSIGYRDAVNGDPDDESVISSSWIRARVFDRFFKPTDLSK
jgi:hypothetical protein